MKATYATTPRFAAVWLALVLVTGACSGDVAEQATPPTQEPDPPATASAVAPTSTPAPLPTDVPTPVPTPLPDPPPTATVQADGGDPTADETADEDPAVPFPPPENLIEWGEPGEQRLTPTELRAVEASLGALQDTPPSDSARACLDADDRALLEEPDFDTDRAAAVDTLLLLVDCVPDAAAVGLAGLGTTGFSGPAEVIARVGECLVAQLDRSEPQRDMVLDGLLTVRRRAFVADEIKVPLQAAMTTCLPAADYASLTIEDASTDPSIGWYLDAACLRDAFDADLVAGMIATTIDMSGRPEEVGAAPPEAIVALFSCVDMGAAISHQVTENLVDLSDETVDCLRDNFEVDQFASEFSQPPNRGESPDYIEALVFDCATEEERALIEMFNR